MHDAAAFDLCQQRARAALDSELELQGAKALCEFLDYPQADEAALDPKDPLRFATVRVMGYLRQHQGGASAELCRFSATARDLQDLLSEEPRRRRGTAQ